MGGRRRESDATGARWNRIEGAVGSRLDRDSGTEIRRVEIRSIRPADSPRIAGENPDHVRLLAEIGTGLTPILVHRATMRVIDGAHRLSAAKLRGETTIAVRFFDGSDHEAFVLAVRENVVHGLPLSVSDRVAAAELIIVSHQGWSDPMIAEAAGIGAR